MGISILVLLGLSLIGLSLIFWLGSNKMIYPKRRALEQRHLDLLASPSELGLHLEAFEAPTKEGFLLKGFIASPIPPGKMGKADRTRRMLDRLKKKEITTNGPIRGTVVLLHGRGGLKENALTIAQRFVAADFRCIVYDARAHGVSEGTYTTYGHREVGDLSRVLDYVQSILSKRDEKTGDVFGFGMSLGAAVLLQSLEKEDRIRAAVAVAPFANFREQVRHSTQKMAFKNVPNWISDGVCKVAGWRADFNPFTIVPIKGAERASVPVFVVHGTKDGVIPIADSRAICASLKNPGKRWREILTGYHRDVLAEGGDDLYQEMIEFYLAELVGKNDHGSRRFREYVILGTPTCDDAVWWFRLSITD